MRIIKIILILLSFQIGFAQDKEEIKYPTFNVKSPGVADFQKYGNINSTSNIGELKLSIPVLSAPVSAGNAVDISINYSGSGFRPTKRSGLVGYNWYLNVGGAITREVNNVPDDQKGHPLTADNDTNYANGFIIGVASQKFAPNDVFNLYGGAYYVGGMFVAPYLYGNATSTPSDKSYEPDPDIFSFNFNGISGKFVMGNDGLIKVTTDSPNNLKVDITQLAFQDDYGINGSKPKASKIIITDNMGNKYSFGGELKNLEYSLSGSIDNNNKFKSDSTPVISSWFLYKIEYQNGSVLNFNYRDDSALGIYFADQFEAEHGNFPAYDPNPSLPNNRDFVVFNEYYSQDRSWTSSGGFASIPVGSNMPTYSLQKIAILDNITCDNFKIVFDYTRQPHFFNLRNSDTDTFPTDAARCLYNKFLDLKLDRITLSDSNNAQVKKVDFLYDHLGGTQNSRMFLKSITEDGKPPHSFEYYPTGTLPKPITCAIDHWGFWNGRDDNTNALIPKLNYDLATGDYTYDNTVIDGSSRDPNFMYALKGQLKKVTYPTAGYSEFEYEQHEYSKRLEIRSGNGYLPILYDVNGVAGGTRIKKITDFDGTSNTNLKEYKYISNFAANGTTSSGILFKYPRYCTAFSATFKPWVGTQIFIYLRSNPIGDVIANSPVIAYSEVTEVNIGNGYTVNKFSDFITHPDSLDYTMLIDHSPGSTCLPLGLAESYMGNLLNDRSAERGKVLSENVYDVNNNLKQQTTYAYNTDSNRFAKFTTRIHFSGPSTFANKIYYYNNYLSEKNTTSYTASGNIVSTEKMVYGALPSYDATKISNQDALIKRNTLTSDGFLVESQYQYPSDVYAAGSANYINFQTANIALPLRESQFWNTGKASESFTVFAKDATTNNILLPKYSYGGKFPNNYANITDIGTLEKKATYDLYDLKGNVTQFTKENGAPVSIIWGYNKTLVVAKIENATNAQVATALGVSVAVLQGYNEANLTALNGLRASLPIAMVTTYTHIRLVGVSTITDPKGDVMTYTYDTLGRLLNVKDKNNNVMSQYQYHYKN